MDFPTPKQLMYTASHFPIMDVSCCNVLLRNLICNLTGSVLCSCNVRNEVEIV